MNRKIYLLPAVFGICVSFVAYGAAWLLALATTLLNVWFPAIAVKDWTDLVIQWLILAHIAMWFVAGSLAYSKKEKLAVTALVLPGYLVFAGFAAYAFFK